MVAVLLGEVLRNLALAEGVIEGIVDDLRRYSVAGGLVAIDGERERRPGHLLVGGDIAQRRQRLELLEHLRRPFVELIEIGVLQRVLELGAGNPSADIDVLRRLKEEPCALDLLELRPQGGQ